MVNYVILLFLSKIHFIYKKKRNLFYFLSVLIHFSNFSTDVQRRLILKILNHLLTNNDQHQRILILYSFFRNIQINRVFDIIIDCFLSINIDQYEWIIKP